MLVSDMSLKSFYDSLKKSLYFVYNANEVPESVLLSYFNVPSTCLLFFYFQFHLSVCFGIFPHPLPPGPTVLFHTPDAL